MNLYELSVKLRQMPGLTAEAAKRAAPRIHAQIASNVRAQTDTNGVPWEPRSPKVKNASGPMLTGAAAAVEVVVRGSAIILSLPWEVYGRHSRGAINRGGRGDRKTKVKRSHKKDPNKRVTPREIIPTNPSFLPTTFARILREEINAVVSEHMGQRTEAA